jgi:hypothetical protein
MNDGPPRALTLSIGVLGGLAVALTAEVITVPIWVVFLTWASFFFVGGGMAGWVRSLSGNLVGVVIASASLYAAYPMGDSMWVTALAVDIGSAAMVQASWIWLFSTSPPWSSGSPARCRRSRAPDATSPSRRSATRA